ncbi:MAG: hypothetical protein AAB267_06270 [Candidatus Desantisbacteria bacterium]
MNRVTTFTDNVPPTTTVSISPEPNQAGWNNSDITITLTATDNEDGSGVKEIHYKLTGATQEEQTIESDTLNLTISNEGTTTLSYCATDNIGNIEEQKSQTFKLDKTSPVITASISPDPNSNHWSNSDVTVTFNATDSLSGIAIATEPQTITSEGKNQNIGGEAKDLAGNTATVYVTLSIDKTPPTITAVSSPQPNSYGWNNSDVTVSFNGEDALSGIDTITQSISVSTEGKDQQINGEAIDLAGNKATASAKVNLDRTPPTITANASPQPNSNGWNNTDVTVTFAGNDILSGIQTITQPFTITTEGANQTITGETVDYADNKAITSLILNIDKTKPTVTISTNPNILWPPNNKMVNVIISGEATDGLSSIATTAFTVEDEYNEVEPALAGFGQTIQLKASRQGSDKDGRLYIISVTTKDKADNQITSSTTVICPHDQGKK